MHRAHHRSGWGSLQGPETNRCQGSLQVAVPPKSCRNALKSHLADCLRHPLRFGVARRGPKPATGVRGDEGSCGRKCFGKNLELELVGGPDRLKEFLREP